MDNSILKRRLAKRAGYACAAILLLGGSMSISSCKDDLLTGTPEWLGSSIYEELEERGQFTQTLALINDPDLSDTNYPDMLRRTGSMTLFVADDAAWGRFLAKRGVSSVNELSKAEKKILLKSAMINNAYLINLLSNLPGDPPTEGSCMRRESRVDIEDSIPVLLAADMPEINPNRVDEEGKQIDHWQNVRDKESIKIYKDATPAPMVHFLPEFMRQNSITDTDISILTNGASQTVERSYVNGYAVAKNDGRWAERDVESTGATKEYLQDITCQNGYIHVLEEVPEQLNNMAEIIASKPQLSTFSKLLERFSYPAWYASQEVGGVVDTFYTKRYFNQSGNHSLSEYTGADGVTVTVNDKLSIDPGWNSYVLYAASSRYTIAENEAAMFVPNNDQMDAYLRGDGKAIGVKYDYDWEKVPDNLVAPFINNCIQQSFVATVPSKFDAMKNTAAEPIGIKPENVVACYMSCNGVVYELNSVFAAPEHESVVFPALLRADNDMSISDMIIKFDPTASEVASDVKSAWKLNEFKAYLNSMSSTYSFLLPSDKAYQYYLDPYSFTEGQKPSAIYFYLDPSSTQPVRATSYLLDESGNVTSELAPSQPTIATVANRLYDIMDNAIVVHGQKGATPFHEGQSIYLTKAGSPVKVNFTGGKVTGIAGSMQANNNDFTVIDPETMVFDMTEKGNGVTYIMNQLPQATIISPDSLLNDLAAHPEYEQFARLMNISSFRAANNEHEGHISIGHPITLFGNYHYTLYVPQNSAINGLIDKGMLPSEALWDEWETYRSALDDYEVPKEMSEEEAEKREAELKTLKEQADLVIAKMRTVVDNFVRFHSQDGSVFLGGEQGSSLYETAAVDTSLNRFYTVNVDNTGDAIKVTASSTSAVANVIPGSDSNKMTRQYLFNDGQIFSSSYIVIHLIDSYLYYKDDQFIKEGEIGMPVWPEWLLPYKPIDDEEEGGDTETPTSTKRYYRR